MHIMWSKITDGERGRPPSPWRSHYDKRLFAYIIRISQKHGVNPDRLRKKLVETKENEKSECETLTIQCRRRTKNYAVFRITSKGSLVAQLRIPHYLLEAEGKLKLNKTRRRETFSAKSEM